MPAKKKASSKKTAKARRMTPKTFNERFEEMVDNIGTVIIGKDEVIRLSLIAMLANGHLLFEDVPGTGKTMLARALAQSFEAEWNRISCTPDLLPADITGTPVLDRKSGEFVFRAGPVFASIFLADEVNRATPKTQSALLEAMQERTVTVDGITHPLPKPFFVLATQNPIELAGTFPLPEAQLDRFLFRLTLGHADAEAEVMIMAANKAQEAIISLDPLSDLDEVEFLKQWCTTIECSEAVVLYIAHLVQATRTEPSLAYGGSTRASLALLWSSRVLAASQGRSDVIPDDVKYLAPAVLTHRLVLSPDAQLREETVNEVIERLVTRVKVPTSGVRRSADSPEDVLAAAG